MTTEIVRVDCGLDNSQTVRRVRALLGCIPKRESAYHQMFCGLRLIRADGVRFTLSIQGSETHYCKPRESLGTLTDYDSVEIGIIPDEQNESAPYRFGRTFEYDYDTHESGFRDIKEGEIRPYGSSEEQRRGWLQPEDVGFKRVQKFQGHDDVVGWVSVQDLVWDLAEFFDAGGVIDASHEDTKNWVDKIMAAVQ
jgi:hypothetical protein